MWWGRPRSWGFAGVLSVGPVGVLLSSDSTPVIKPLALVWGWWWVWLGGTRWSLVRNVPAAGCGWWWGVRHAVGS